jgi:hypothetical protein
MSNHDTIMLTQMINANDLFQAHLFIDMGANVQEAIDNCTHITDQMVSFLFSLGYDIQLQPKTTLNYVSPSVARTFSGKHELEPPS